MQEKINSHKETGLVQKSNKSLIALVEMADVNDQNLWNAYGDGNHDTTYSLNHGTLGLTVLGEMLINSTESIFYNQIFKNDTVKVNNLDKMVFSFVLPFNKNI